MSTQMLNDGTFDAANVAKVPASTKTMSYGGVVSKTLVLLIFTVIPFWIGYRWGWKRCRRAAGY